MDAFLFLRRAVRERHQIRYALATEALLEQLAEHFGADAALWGLTGLLAAVDHDLTEHNPKSRGRTAADMLRAERLPALLVRAVGERLGPGPHDALLIRALAAAEAAAMVVLDGVGTRAELAQLDGRALETLCDDASNAPQASRSRILALAEDGVSLADLLLLAQAALLARADDLDL